MWVLFFPFSTVNRWLGEKEVRYFVLPSFVLACVCLQVSSSQIYVPTSLTDTHAADRVNSAVLESAEGKR